MDRKQKAKLTENYRHSNTITITFWSFISLILGSFLLGFASYSLVLWFFQ